MLEVFKKFKLQSSLQFVNFKTKIKIFKNFFGFIFIVGAVGAFLF